MNRRAYSVVVLGGILLFCTCISKGRPTSTAPAVEDSCEDSVRLKELPLPEVPQTMPHPEERAAYIIAHFWDGMDFGDTLRCRDRAFMEQNFVNYLSLFPHARQETLPPHIARLLERAAADSQCLDLVNDLAEHYLDAPNSPMRNEEYYILFLEGLLRLPALPETERIRPAYRLEMARKNRPGTTAADFAYTDRHGNRRTLHATRGKRLLLLFYDPACSHCSQILDGLRQSAVIAGLIANRELAVLAVYTEGDRRLWDDTKASMPREWSVAIDESRIVERELYALPAMPVIYLLDGQKTVLLKDPSPMQLEAFLDGGNGLQ